MAINTVLVIGAGASKEAGLPTGYELKSKISKLYELRGAENNGLYRKVQRTKIT